MANNKSLHKAKVSKNDEFYTQLSDIEKELIHYREHFNNKIVLCNCDDPFESNFFKYFALNFNVLGLKKLICTSYANSPIAGDQLSLFPDEENTKRRTPYKAIVTRIHDANGDGGVSMSDIKMLFEDGENTLEELEGDGDFRSKECLSLMEEADIVVTNPPFSLFREYAKTLLEHQKKFVIMGNKNAITYKEFFPLLRENKVWVGATSLNGGRWMIIPKGIKPKSDKTKINDAGETILNVSGVCWFTNLDITKRHEELLLVDKYDPEKYPKYDNYDAIDVGYVSDIPCDYEECYLVPVKYKEKLKKAGFPVDYERLNSKGELCVSLFLSLSLSKASIPQEHVEYCSGIMGVPITFLDKYNPKQFQIVGTDYDFAGSIVLNGKEKANPQRMYVAGVRKYARILVRKLPSNTATG